jgi:ligand-binding sensor domain-containing protein
MCFDGTQFIPWRMAEGRMPLTTVTYLLASRDGSLWIGTTHGLARLKDGQYFEYTRPNDRAGINKIFEDLWENMGDAVHSALKDAL